MKIGRIGGVEVRVETSLLVLAGLITFDLWQFLFAPERFPQLGRGAAFALAVLTTLLFVGSILAHELAHAAVFRSRGIEVRGITLYLFGGLTAAKSEARRPIDEFLVTAAGPLTTGLIGGVFLGLHAIGQTEMSHPWRAMFGYLALLNLLMAAFNLLPGFPLDGGRLLLSALWRVTGSRARATAIAARVGQVVAILIAAGGLVLAVRSGQVLGWALWPVLVGAMLYQGATSALSDAARRSLLESVTAGRVMSPPPPTVPADLTVGDAMQGLLTGREGEAFPVMDDGQVVGFISLRMARESPPDRAVREAMIGTDAVAVARPDERMSEVAARVQDRSAQIVLVVDGGRLAGVIEREDLARLFRSAGRPAPAPVGPAGGPPPRPDTGGGLG